MSTLANEERIGAAWRLHRDGKHAAAIEMYQDILKRTPSNLDALYGLGLAFRNNGDLVKARESLQKAFDIAQRALDGVASASEAEGHHGANDLDTYEDDRFMMLSRMLQQRLGELDGAK